MTTKREYIKEILLERIFSEQSENPGFSRKYFSTHKKPVYTSTDKWHIQEQIGPCESITFNDTNSWWARKRNKNMTIDHQALTIRGKTYNWENILTTHIKFIGDDDNEEYYLTLGLDDGELVDFDLYPYSFSKKLFISKAHQLAFLCSAIEYFKLSPTPT